MKKSPLYKYTSLKDISCYSLILLFFLLPVLFSPAVSKFLSDWSGNLHSILSQDFYFHSDDLMDSSITSAEPSIMFELKNYNDDDYNKNNIEYDVKVFNNGQEVTGLDYSITNLPSDSASNTYNNSNHGVLTGNYRSRNVVNISGFPLNDGQTTNFNVVVSSTKPYSKSLRANYSITHLSNYQLASIDISSSFPYVFVTVNANDFEGEKNFYLEWNSDKVVPDNTDSSLQNIAETSRVNLQLRGNSSYVYRFIAIDNSVSDSDFKLTQIT